MLQLWNNIRDVETKYFSTVLIEMHRGGKRWENSPLERAVLGFIKVLVGVWATCTTESNTLVRYVYIDHLYVPIYFQPLGKILALSLHALTMLSMVGGWSVGVRSTLRLACCIQWSASLPGLFTPRRTVPVTHCGLYKRSERLEKEMFLFLSGIEPRFLGRLVRSLVAIPTDFAALAPYLCLFQDPYIAGAKFWTVEPSICGYTVRIIFHVALLTRRILMRIFIKWWHPDVFIVCVCIWILWLRTVLGLYTILFWGGLLHTNALLHKPRFANQMRRSRKWMCSNSCG
jgi:hypothetical protein